MVPRSPSAIIRNWNCYNQPRTQGLSPSCSLERERAGRTETREPRLGYYSNSPSLIVCVLRFHFNYSDFFKQSRKDWTRTFLCMVCIPLVANVINFLPRKPARKSGRVYSLLLYNFVAKTLFRLCFTAKSVSTVWSSLIGKDTVVNFSAAILRR